MSYKPWLCGVALAGVVLTPAFGAAQTAGTAPAPQTAQKVDDSTLDTRVEARLKADPSLKKDTIDVAVSDGVVTLTGTVHSRTQRARAERLAKIKGVTRVENKLEVETAATTGEKARGTMDKAADKSEKTLEKAADKTKKAGEKTKDESKKVGAKTKDVASDTGEAITDAWITTKVKTQFVGEDALKGSDINVDTNDHVVTLKGTVASEAGRTRAVAIAKATKGVTRVVDDLTISPKK
jgi:hyperosmotically inducible protein